MTSNNIQSRRSSGQPAALRAAVSLTLSALAVWSQAAIAQTSQTNDELTPVTVSASRFANDPTFAPVAATVITADQIRDAGVSDANEAIRKLGGVYGRQSTAAPKDFPLDLRGFGTTSDQNVVVLLDGVRISENEQTPALLSSIPVDSIERIEIVRGGSSVLYGAGATGGTIQIITKRAQRNTGYGSVTGEIGSFGERTGRAFAARAWENMSIDASYDKSHIDGWRDNRAANQENFSTKLQWFGDDWRFGLRATKSKSDYGLAGSLTPSAYNANPRQAQTPYDYASYDNDSITAFLERRFGSVDVAAELSHREKILRSRYISYGTQSQSDIRGTQFSPRIRHVGEFGKLKNEAIAGIDLYEWSNHTNGTYPSDASQHSKAVYLRDEIEFDKNARIAAGVRREVFNQSSILTGYDKNNSVSAWDVQASYAPLPLLRGFVKTGQSYRLAVPDENYGLSTTTLLKPQVSHDLEAGATWGTADRQLTVRWFRHRLHDEIYFDSTTYANINLDPTRHQGVELEGRLRVTDTVLLSATYQHVEAKFTEGVNSGKELGLVPKNTVSARVNWKSGNQSADAGVRWADRQREGNDFANTCARMPSFTVLDARYAVRVSAWEFAVTGNNLADRKYYSQAYDCSGGQVSGIYPESGRAVKFTARYDF